MSALAVTLAPWECEVVKHVGRLRLAEAERMGHKTSFDYKTPAEGLRFHVLGAAAECACAKVLGLYWNMGVNTRRAVPDVGIAVYGTGIEVRWAARPALKVRAVDPAGMPVVLVQGGDAARFLVGGWMHAGEARKLVAPSSPRPGVAAYFVPADQLHSLDTLVDAMRSCMEVA